MLLSDLIGQDVPLVRKGSGNRYWRDKDHPSFEVDNVRGKWNHYSLGLWGDAADWLVYRHKFNNSEAWNKAKEIESVVLETKELPLDKLQAAQKKLRYATPTRYLIKRHILPETAARFKLGYLYNKIVLPNYTQAGELCSIRYRFIVEPSRADGTTLRYISEEGSRSWSPYGLWLVPKQGEVLFVTEGEFKSICVSQMGFFCISTAGTAFRPSWVELLSGWEHIVYLRDSHEIPGLRAALGVAKLMPRATLIGTPRPYKAVDDYYDEHPHECYQFLKEIENGFSSTVDRTKSREILEGADLPTEGYRRPHQ